MDGLNNTEFARLHRGAITGYYPCCGIWGVSNNGSFELSPSSPPGVFQPLVDMGMEVVPTGGFGNKFLLEQRPQWPTVIAAMVSQAVAQDWQVRCSIALTVVSRSHDRSKRAGRLAN